ncbi:MAG TPA: phosphoadenylyl-sulfate reductase [Actinomycetota bacterium]|nr:phosphoadenylyl-sulfate reductase [Actinomycetota bacterium]
MTEPDAAAEARAAADRLAGASAADVLAWATATFGDRFAVVTAFQAEGMVVLDLARRADPAVRVLTIDTGRLPQETYDVIETVRARWGMTVEVLAPDTRAVEAMTSRHGPNLFRRDQALRLLCCQVRKVDPLAGALAGLDAWASGLRRDETPARARVAPVEVDLTHGGIVKLNPLATWSREQVWAYVREHGLPVHPLYERGYTSIGCAPCTRAVAPGEGRTEGRWWWEAGADRECGLHHQTPSERFDAALTTLRADVGGTPRRAERDRDVGGTPPAGHAGAAGR